MSFGQGNNITAADINQLKADLKAEVARRKYTGNISNYANSYEYTTTPTSGGMIELEHQTKLAEQMQKINTSSISIAIQGDLITDLDTQRTLVTNWAGYGYNSTTSGCSSSCTGLCTNGCGNACSGCTGTCTGCSGCSGTCTGCSGCSGTCSGTCSNTCSGGCTGCSDGCATSCGDLCGINACSNGCQKNCAPTCSTGPGLVS